LRSQAGADRQFVKAFGAVLDRSLCAAQTAFAEAREVEKTRGGPTHCAGVPVIRRCDIIATGMQMSIKKPQLTKPACPPDLPAQLRRRAPTRMRTRLVHQLRDAPMHDADKISPVTPKGPFLGESVRIASGLTPMDYGAIGMIR
jgi:hypothetical protein